MQLERIFTYFAMFLSIILTHVIVHRGRVKLTGENKYLGMSYNSKEEKLSKAATIGLTLCGFILIGFICQWTVPTMMNGKLAFCNGTAKEIVFVDHIVSKHSDRYVYDIVLDSSEGELVIPYSRSNQETDLAVGEELEFCLAPGEEYWTVSRRNGVETPAYKAYYRGYGTDNAADQIAVSVILAITLLSHIIVYRKERGKETGHKVKIVFGAIWLMGLILYTGSMVLGVMDRVDYHILRWGVLAAFTVFCAGEYFYILANGGFCWVTSGAYEEEETWTCKEMEEACSFWGAKLGRAIRDNNLNERQEAGMVMSELSKILQKNRPLAEECLPMLMDEDHITMVRMNAAVDAMMLGIQAEKAETLLEWFADGNAYECFALEAKMLLEQWKEYGKMSLCRCKVYRLQPISERKTDVYGESWAEIWTIGVRTLMILGAIAGGVILTVLKCWFADKMQWWIVGVSAGIIVFLCVLVEGIIRHKARAYRDAKEIPFELAKIKMVKNALVELWREDGEVILYTLGEEYEEGEEVAAVYLPKLKKVESELMKDLDEEEREKNVVLEEELAEKCEGENQLEEDDSLEEIPENALELQPISNLNTSKYWKYKCRRSNLGTVLMVAVMLIWLIYFVVYFSEMGKIELIVELIFGLILVLGTAAVVWENIQLRKSKKQPYEIAFFNVTGEKKQTIQMVRENKKVLSYVVGSEDDLKKGEAVVIYMPAIDDIFVISRARWRKIMM